LTGVACAASRAARSAVLQVSALVHLVIWGSYCPVMLGQSRCACVDSCSLQGSGFNVLVNGRPALNLASSDFLGLGNDSQVQVRGRLAAGIAPATWSRVRCTWLSCWQGTRTRVCQGLGAHLSQCGVQGDAGLGACAGASLCWCSPNLRI